MILFDIFIYIRGCKVYQLGNNSYYFDLDYKIVSLIGIVDVV